MQGPDDAPDGLGFREINVTPLVDVMLVLLIVFMVTAPLMQASLSVEVPRVAGQTTAATSEATLLTITADARVWAGEREITATLSQALAEVAPRSAGVRIRADRSVRYDAVARVLAAARTAGIEQIDLVVDVAEAG